MSLSRYLDNFFWFKIQINYIPVIVLINPITYPKHKSNELLFGKLEPVKVLASKNSFSRGFSLFSLIKDSDLSWSCLKKCWENWSTVKRFSRIAHKFFNWTAWSVFYILAKTFGLECTLLLITIEVITTYVYRPVFLTDTNVSLISFSALTGN